MGIIWVSSTIVGGKTQIQISMIKKSELDPELESNKKRVRRKGVISFATISQILVRRTAPEISSGALSGPYTFALQIYLS
jgi:hypothetical protein